jgi:hypothetical protein
VIGGALGCACSPVVINGEFLGLAGGFIPPSASPTGTSWSAGLSVLIGCSRR